MTRIGWFVLLKILCVICSSILPSYFEIVTIKNSLTEIKSINTRRQDELKNTDMDLGKIDGSDFRLETNTRINENRMGLLTSCSMTLGK